MVKNVHYAISNTQFKNIPILVKPAHGICVYAQLEIKNNFFFIVHLSETFRPLKSIE